MNCCDDYGQCKRGPGCPVRPQCIADAFHRPIDTTDDQVEWLAAVAIRVAFFALATSGGLLLYRCAA